ncbi:hypothetical protein F4781DRAFT_421217 [Annulohypoxylon bovei var. microspora]|nr:hypothetical protein F4781DRAFT_421217 [Annulohypoxylon bovei var. microspora]
MSSTEPLDRLPLALSPNYPASGEMILGVTWVFTSMTIIALILRLLLHVGRLGLDDWFMVAAEICQIVFQGLVTIQLYWGLEWKQDGDPNTHAEYIQYMKYGWIASTPAILVSVLARISATLLLNRLFASKKWFRWYLYVFTTVETCVGTLAIISIWLQTTPIEATWNVTMVGSVHHFGFDTRLISSYHRLETQHETPREVIVNYDASPIVNNHDCLDLETDHVFEIHGPVRQGTVEKSRSIIMGCIPKLRHIAKLLRGHPIFSTFSKKVRSRSQTREEGTSRENLSYATYHETDSQGRQVAWDGSVGNRDVVNPNLTVVCAREENDIGLEMISTDGIRRVDAVTITYERKTEPQESVSVRLKA